MSKIIIFILAITLPSAAFAECSFDWDSDCSEEYNAIFYGDQPQGGDCMCTETSSSSSSTQWVPNPSGNGGNYETVTTPGTTRQVPCPCD